MAYKRWRWGFENNLTNRTLGGTGHWPQRRQICFTWESAPNKGQIDKNKLEDAPSPRAEAGRRAPPAFTGFGSTGSWRRLRLSPGQGTASMRWWPGNLVRWLILLREGRLSCPQTLRTDASYLCSWDSWLVPASSYSKMSLAHRLHLVLSPPWKRHRKRGVRRAASEAAWPQQHPGVIRVCLSLFHAVTIKYLRRVIYKEKKFFSHSPGGSEVQYQGAEIWPGLSCWHLRRASPGRRALRTARGRGEGRLRERTGLRWQSSKQLQRELDTASPVRASVHTVHLQQQCPDAVRATMKFQHGFSREWLKTEGCSEVIRKQWLSLLLRVSHRATNPHQNPNYIFHRNRKKKILKFVWNQKCLE